MKKLVILMAAWVIPFTATAQDMCPNGIVSVDADDPALLQRVCAASDRALALFSDCDAPFSTPVTIHMRDSLQDGCMGLYHCGISMIEVLTPDALARIRNPDGIFAHIPVNDLFDSVVVHELTHARYDGTPCPYDSCLATAEYLAHSVQLSTLPAPFQAPLSARRPEDKKINRDSISTVMYMFAPELFALNAWSHFKQRPDQCLYLRQILDGAIVFDHFMP